MTLSYPCLKIEYKIQVPKQKFITNRIKQHPQFKKTECNRLAYSLEVILEMPKFCCHTACWNVTAKFQLQQIHEKQVVKKCYDIHHKQQWSTGPCSYELPLAKKVTMNHLQWMPCCIIRKTALEHLDFPTAGSSASCLLSSFMLKHLEVSHWLQRRELSLQILLSCRNKTRILQINILCSDLCLFSWNTTVSSPPP